MDQSFDAFGGGGGYGDAHAGGYGDAGGFGNQSFVAPTAGGFGDNSFAGTQAAPKTTDFDRITIPVTVATLNSLDPTAERVTYGNYHFTTVRIIAEVVNTIDQPESTEVRYMIRDCGNEQQEPFLVIQYFGIDGTDRNTFIEGTMVHVIGKIRSFDNHTAVVAFKVFEVNEMNLRDVFPREARIAELYFTKNIPDRIQLNEVAQFKSTMLSAEAPQSNSKGAAAPSTPGRMVQNNMDGAAVYQPSQQHAGAIRGGLNYQQNRIMEFMKSRGPLGEEGLGMAVIRSGIRGDANFDHDIHHLADNGYIFSTVDDEHYNYMES